MNEDSSHPFAEESFVKARLLQQVVYREDGAIWETLLRSRDEIGLWFRQVGQELVLDEGEGFAFLRQIELEGGERVPRLVQRRALSYTATLLLVCLRDELSRFDAAADLSAKLVQTRDQLRDLVGTFVRETSNQKRDLKPIDNAIARLCDLGFLREMMGEEDRFEVMRVIKARVTPEVLESVKERLIRYAGTGA